MIKIKTNLKLVSLFCFLIFSLTVVPVSAAVVYKTIKVQLNSVKIKVNGTLLKNDNFVYNGTTYVPLRSISEMFGKDVAWDSKTNTVNISDKSIKPKTWNEVIRFEGEGIKNTQTFHVSSNEWQIDWSTQPEEYDSYFAIHIYNSDGSPKDPFVVANIIGAGHSIDYVRGSGDYYLTINSGQPYTVIIKENS